MTYSEKMLKMQLYDHSISQLATTIYAHAKQLAKEDHLVTIAIPSLNNEDGKLKLFVIQKELERGPRGPG
ncbi:hypothetical protein [Desulfotruncus alcoholivorax]|uniref:hypothetical protein n=1 Tax=Desulfotruncus alcoholivorax TaxID=265477 RepID=UPI000483F3B3|nr:hypothetical protein [Desulfotruncus alcoholivorax]